MSMKFINRVNQLAESIQSNRFIASLHEEVDYQKQYLDFIEKNSNLIMKDDSSAEPYGVWAGVAWGLEKAIEDQFKVSDNPDLHKFEHYVYASLELLNKSLGVNLRKYPEAVSTAKSIRSMLAKETKNIASKDESEQPYYLWRDVLRALVKSIENRMRVSKNPDIDDFHGGLKLALNKLHDDAGVRL